MKLKKGLSLALALILMCSILSGCGEDPATPADSQVQPTGGASAEPIKVALVVNQKFGDMGPCDQMAAGLERAKTDFDLEIKALESDGVASFEDDLRAMAKDGYDLIITTFPDMSEATKTIAREFPDTSFGAIYQFINSETESIPNVYDAQFQGQEAMYILGAMAAKLTRTGKVGFIAGAEEPSPNADGNAFMQAIQEYGPGCEVKFSYVGSYEDVARAKEIAVAMIADGCDIIQTDAGKNQIGIMEAAKEAGILVCGDTSDYSENYPDGVYGYFGGDFENCVYLIIQDYVQGSFKGGTTGIMNLANNCFYLTPEMFQRFAENRTDYTESMNEAITLYEELNAKVHSGELKIDFNTDTPNWSNYQ